MDSERAGTSNAPLPLHYHYTTSHLLWVRACACGVFSHSRAYQLLLLFAPHTRQCKIALQIECYQRDCLLLPFFQLFSVCIVLAPSPSTQTFQNGISSLIPSLRQFGVLYVRCELGTCRRISTLFSIVGSLSASAPASCMAILTKARRHGFSQP